ncbi:glycosyltransferase family 4 protein [Spirosoma foliorum]|uniref:Glycosyltransferase family 4 protein n=1 Tax=Spirosoma foliorum TaxID=2710596 RepID=A0A7G5GYP2_9BACT|nr:glycosyltransferase family 1 protein [Spirosoma foliorum]QMW03984.1 glycosyltransferase family 4 protein [Spirosoma foliorum]
MKVILISNYPLDRQESMDRFAQMLSAAFRDAGIETEVWRPKVLLAAWFKSSTSGLGKWVGYLDKWLVFPWLLRWRQVGIRLSRKEVRFHICDHSNAPYLAHLPIDKTVITCHDVIAIRGALGCADAYWPTSGLGKLLQKWILTNLSRAKRIACDSQQTFDQLNEVTAGYTTNRVDWRVVHVGFNARFEVIQPEEKESLLSKAGIQPGVPFILHVGSWLPRKNRRMLIDMVHSLGSQWTGTICFAGNAVDESLMSHARSVGLQDRIWSVEEPDHATLVALYNACDSFIFPSFSEGFGWPLIEAQACGAPVIASHNQPMPEISGGAAFHLDPTKPAEFANAFLALQDKDIRQDLIRRGFENTKRFEPIHMVNTYIELHGLKRPSISPDSVTPASVNLVGVSETSSLSV